MNATALKTRLIVMNFLIFAVWGAYLCSLGVYLGGIGMGVNIGSFFAIQGIVSLFMPALMGIVADKWIPAQKLLGICHGLAALFMALAGYMGMKYGDSVTFGQLFPFYAISVAFFMPTIALGNSVSYNALTKGGLDTVRDYPPIRVFGTIGFIVSMWIVDLTGFKNNYMQMFVSSAWGVLLALYSFTLPDCPVSKGKSGASIVEALGLRAFTLFKDSKMCLFFIFVPFGNVPASDKRLRGNVFGRFRQESCVCRHIRRSAQYNVEFAFADIGDSVHLAYTVFP